MSTSVVPAHGAALRPGPALQVAILVSVVWNLGRIPVFGVGEQVSAPILVNDIAVAMALLVAAVVAVRNRSLRLDSVALAALLFAAVGGLSAIAAVPRLGLNGFELVVSLAYLARWLVYLGIYVLVINYVRHRDVEPLWRAIETMLLLFAAFGIVQSIFLPGFAQMVYPDSRVMYDWDYQGHRLVSTLLEPNVAAAMMMLGLLVHLGRLSCGVDVPRWKPALLFVAMVMTLSRSGALGLITGGAVIMASRGLSKRVMRLGAAALIVALLSLPKLIPFMMEYGKLSLGGSAAGRLVNLAIAGKAFLEHPWIGIGFNTFGFYIERIGMERLGWSAQSSDGGLLFAAVMTGLVGVSIYVTMLALVIRRCRAVWRSERFSAEERGLCLGVAAGVLGLCVHSVFVNSLFTTAILLPAWTLWGLTYVIGREGPTEAHAEVAATAVVARG